MLDSRAVREKPLLALLLLLKARRRRDLTVEEEEEEEAMIIEEEGLLLLPPREGGGGIGEQTSCMVWKLIKKEEKLNATTTYNKHCVVWSDH